jgi:hypothetical protein
MKKSKNASAAELKAIPDAAEKEMRQAGRVQLMASCVLCFGTGSSAGAKYLIFFYFLWYIKSNNYKDNPKDRQKKYY